jgi:hypothetical protein
MTHHRLSVHEAPFVFVLYREVVASLLMLSYARYRGLRLHIEKEDYSRFLLLGAVNCFCLCRSPPVVILVYYAIGTGYTIVLSAIFAYTLTPGGNLFYNLL